MPSRSLLLPGLLALAVVAATAAPVAAFSGGSTSSSTSSPPRLAATLTACSTGSSESARAATFTGSMPRRPGADRLWMRFDLERRDTRTGRWTSVSAPTFARWEKSRSGVAGFVYRKRVEGLAAPGTYRVVVRFRWKASTGRTVRSATRTTRVCRQPDPRPNLRVEQARLGLDGTTLDITVTNAGRSRTTAPAALVVRHGAAEVAMASIPAVAPDETVTVTVPVPPCGEPGTYEVVVDPADGIDEADERDNVHVVTCFG